MTARVRTAPPRGTAFRPSRQATPTSYQTTPTSANLRPLGAAGDAAVTRGGGR